MTGSTADARRTARVVHVSGNDVLSDARVLKYLATMDALGLETHAVGVSRSGPREVRVGRVQVHVLHSPATLRTRLAGTGGQLRVVLGPRYRTADDARAARAQLVRWRGSVGRRGGAVGLAAHVVLGALGAWSRAVSAWSPRREVPAAPQDDARGRAVERARARLRGTALDRVLPQLAADERVVGPELDRLAPDLIHVHDVFMLAAAGRAVRRARAAGRDVRLVYDAHELVPGVAFVPVRTVAALATLEEEAIREADRVVTVSEPLAAILHRTHTLPVRPVVVLNAPVVAAPPPGFADLRAVTGTGAPLLVYGGGVNTARGVQTAVEALVRLPGVHLAVVTHVRNYVVEALLARAAELGVADRVHLAPYVDPEHVPAYLGAADVGLSTLLHAPNHDVAVTNKFCEYLQAGLPVVTSDTPAQAELVRGLDLGAVYPAGDAAALATAVRAVLDDATRLRERIGADDALRRRFSWTAQAETVRTLYQDLLSELPAEAWRPGALELTALGERE